MTRREIKDAFLKLATNDDIKTIFSDGKQLIADYYDLLNHEKEKYIRIENEGVELSEEQVTERAKNQELDKEIRQLIAEYEKTKQLYQKEKKENEKQNLSQKKKILNELQDIVENEKVIKNAFDRIKKVHSDWKEIGNIPRENYNEIQSKYSKLNEEFHYNINIYKALKENDLKKNYSLKNQVIHELEELQKQEHIKTLQNSLNQLQNQWDEIGPTFTAEWEQLKAKYWELVNNLREKIQHFYQDRELQLHNNLVEKQNIINQVTEWIQTLPDNHKEWDKLTKKIIDSQAKWKSIGPIPQEKSDETWTDVKALYDHFFAEKSVFYNARNEENKVFANKKRAIIEKAEELKTSDQWKDTTNALIKLQEEWKKIGNAGRAETSLWKKFRAACDHFFDNKKNYFDNKDQIELENLNNKNKIIEEVKQFAPSSDNIKEIKQELRSFAHKFNAIGNVPIKEKNKIQTAFREALNVHYDKINVGKDERQNLVYESKIETLLSKPNAQQLIKNEQQFLRKKINQINAEIQKLENNIGFLGNSKGMDAFKQQFEEKINNFKQQIDTYKAKLSMLKKSAEAESQP